MQTAQTVLPPEQLCRWLSGVLHVPEAALSVQQIAGDASPRRYFRVSLCAESLTTPRYIVGADDPAITEQDSPTAPSEPRPVLLTQGDTLIAASSPPSENNEAFLAVQNLLDQAGLTVPSLLASDLDSGFFLMEDFGDVLLSARLSPATVDHLYAQALGELTSLARLPCGDVDLPVFDAQRIADELSVFPEWFLQKHLGLSQADLPSAIWQELLALLISVFREQSQCVVHRDFHSRNIMCLVDGRLGIIDFQDAVLGPVTYDPVSLLKDCYVRWPRDDQLRWLDAYREQLATRGVDISDDSQSFARQFDLVGLQRHLRVLGVFARLCLRDQKPDYLNDLPLVLDYVREALARYDAEPAVGAFSDWFERTVMPKVSIQHWYSDQRTDAR
ncbi:phosphotransferase [Luminiphilus sp.]|nr:phosphotransferase [Luminiphilus sp.]